jgi:hypothetical protein
MNTRGYAGSNFSLCISTEHLFMQQVFFEQPHVLGAKEKRVKKGAK